MDKMFCVEFQRNVLKLHKNNLPYTEKSVSYSGGGGGGGGGLKSLISNSLCTFSKRCPAIALTKCQKLFRWRLFHRNSNSMENSF